MIRARVYGKGLTLPKRLSKFPDRLIEKYAKEARAQIQRYTPVRTGWMKRNWQVFRRRDKWVLHNPVYYTKYVIRGTRKIHPKRRSYLLLHDKRTGRILAKKRWVRGQTANPIHLRAIERARPTIAVALRKMLLEV